jgi:uridine phosphorylase
MPTLAPSELILNPNGSIYHLNLLPEHISDTILAVGDPDRVSLVSKYFDEIEFQTAKREFVTHTGYYKGKRLTVLSSGIGTDNVDILLNELDALVNIDFVSRQLAEDRISLRIVRVGTSGALQETVPVGSHLVSEYAVGFDTLMQFYPLAQTGFENSVGEALQEKLNLGFRPYCVRGTEQLHRQVAYDMIPGNTVTCPGFYGPQGRSLRLQARDPHLVQALHDFRQGDFRLTNFEMETAGYYSLGQLLGHEVISLNAIVANRITGQFAQDPIDIIDDLILKTLDRLVRAPEA